MNNDDKKLQDIAQKIISNIDHNEDDKEFGAIITILIIISIVLTVIRVIQECNKNVWIKWDRKEKVSYFGSQIKDKAKQKSWLTRRIIKKAIRKELSRDDYKKYNVAIMNSLLNLGATLTDDEINTLAEKANV